MTATRVSEFLVRMAFCVVTRGLLRIRVVGAQNIPHSGPALLAANHVTFLDGLITGFCVRRAVVCDPKTALTRLSHFSRVYW